MLTSDVKQLLEEGTKGIRIPGPGTPIYKDQCMFSFDDPETESGLYICLHKFWGLGEDVLERYHAKTGSKLFLHYRRIKTKIEKDETDQGPEKKVTRFAIGVEGGFTDNSEQFSVEEHYKVVIMPGRHIVPFPHDDLPPQLQTAAVAIIASDSAHRLAELESLTNTWDGEVRQVSKYAENLIQLDNGKKIPPKGWKCEAEGCSLTENLWLNLTDGAIRCGRRYADGSGGNNHGIEYYNITKYPLAVKLGTISSTSKADVFSYDEDDMVEDPQLSKHLAHFGINMAAMEKTDKSMAELEIEVNQRVWEWEALQEAGSKLNPLFGPGLTGMVNLGNSCYMNSVMQVLFHIPSFQQRFLCSANRYFDASADPANDFNVQMAKLCNGLWSGKYSKKIEMNGEETKKSEGGVEQRGIIPFSFRTLVGKGHVEFSTKRQQDAQEFFFHLVQLLERNSRLEDNPADCFKFQVEDKVVCDVSGQVRYNHRTESCLPLTIPEEAGLNKAEVQEYEKKKQLAEANGTRVPASEFVRLKVSLEACLQAFVAQETLSPFYSSATKTSGTASKYTRLATFPDYLMIQVKKFKVGHDWTPQKLDCSVDMPLDLDLSILQGHGMQAHEVALPEDDIPAPAKPIINENMVAELMGMGFTRNASLRGMQATGHVGSELASNWLIEHLNDADLNDPVDLSKVSGNAFAPNPEALEMISSMGFTIAQATMALKATDNNVERAIDWIFSHTDEIANADSFMDTSSPNRDEKNANPGNPIEAGITNGPPKYQLFAFVSHMGTSSTVGHYVCHIRLGDGTWALFNDSKVCASENLPKDLGYLYIYKRA